MALVNNPNSRRLSRGQQFVVINWNKIEEESLKEPMKHPYETQDEIEPIETFYVNHFFIQEKASAICQNIR